MGVIHFADLDELVNELQPGQTVRVAVLDVTEQVFKKYGVRRAGIGVHVRAFTGAHILSCYIPIAMLQVAGGVPPCEQGQFQEYAAAKDQAGGCAEQVKAYLAERGFDARPGIIDLRNIKPMAGGWARRPQATSPA